MSEKFVGMVEGFTLTPFLDAAELLVQADEPERALQLLDNLPAYYRDNPPREVTTLREQILRSLCTPHTYSQVDMDATIDVRQSVSLLRGLLRGQVFEGVMKALSQTSGELGIPHIVDMGPGEYWLPLGLQTCAYEFTYQDVSLLQRTATQARELLRPEIFRAPKSEAPYLFVAFELIEHLMNPMELGVEALRHGGRMPDYVFLSTPLYTYDGRKKDWKKREGQPHLRAYTPNEFIQEANRVFPGYRWELKFDQIQVLKGEKIHV